MVGLNQAYQYIKCNGLNIQLEDRDCQNKLKKTQPHYTDYKKII